MSERNPDARPLHPRLPPEAAITEVQRRQAETVGWLAHGRFLLFVASFLLGGLFLAGAAYMTLRMVWFQGGTSHPELERHFKYGSIGAELASGMPLRILRVLPTVFPEHFAPEGDWSRFGLILEASKTDTGEPRYDVYGPQGVTAASTTERQSKGLPVGFAHGWRSGIEVAWFNCAVCHTGVVQVPGSVRPRIVTGMPANTVELEPLFLALFDMAVDGRFNLASFEAAMPPAERLNWFERQLWAWVVVPNTRNTLIERRSQLIALFDPARAAAPRSNADRCVPVLSAKPGCEASFEVKRETATERQRATTVTRWGPGRVDTFNPYKMMNFGIDADCLSVAERNGASDFPSVFYQGPRGRQGMHLHWDGNNASLAERNLSAALGAGVTEATVDHGSLARLSGWLSTLAPPPSPYIKDIEPARRESGRGIYMRACASCHGYQGANGYVFDGAKLGSIEPIAYVGTSRGRLDSYTVEMEKYQKDRLFCGFPEHRFRQFKKTDGYANAPLDGLWLRAPYLHNGSVPTLADLLEKPQSRPRAFLRGRQHIALDGERGGFVAPSCVPAADQSREPGSFCFDTSLPGNSNAGHLYGTDLSADEKRDLLAYLLTF